MKAWRKHNADLTAKITNIDKERSISGGVEFCPEDFKATKKLEEKRKELKSLYLNNKIERRGQYSAEVSQPSQLLYILFAHVGLPTPPEFKTFMEAKLRGTLKSD